MNKSRYQVNRSRPTMTEITYHPFQLLGQLGDVINHTKCISDRREERLRNHRHGVLVLVQRLHNMNNPRVAQADEPRRIRPDYIKEGILGGLGESGAGAGLRQSALVEDPDGDEGVLGRRAGAGPGGVDLPGEGGAAGSDLVEEIVVLEGLRTCYFLDGGGDGLFDHGGGFG